ncbi:MAG TPA: hypothetical protein VFY26_06675 [Anaerolineales bacterium]|nr:hypothetical protein [Anaerolineales bacterium]
MEQETTNLILVVMALGAILVHILLSGQYGFHRDELDFILNARRLDRGYVSYPPVTPFYTRLGLEMFGESLRAAPGMRYGPIGSGSSKS